MTNEQIDKLKERLERLEYMNSNPIFTVTFIDVKLFQDELGNLFLSYLAINEVDKTNEMCYLEYDETGKETILNKSGNFTSDELKDMFMTLKPFAF